MKRKNGLQVVMARMRLSSTICAMRRLFYLLIAFSVSVTLQAHSHHHGHSEVKGHVCSHGEHQHAECSLVQPTEGNVTGVLKCSACSGSGRCFMCMGSGIIYSIMGPTYCPGCNGLGKCGMCGGNGLIIIPDNPVPIPEPVPDPKPTPGSHACRVCNGTGKKISERWMGSQTSERKWCSICNKNVLQTHQHVRCDNCNGTGRVKY